MNNETNMILDILTGEINIKSLMAKVRCQNIADSGTSSLCDLDAMYGEIDELEEIIKEIKAKHDELYVIRVNQLRRTR